MKISQEEALKIRILEFIKQHHIAAIATVNSYSLPEASIVGFAVRHDFTIHIATYDSSRKFLNLKRNPRVALVVGWEHGKTVQIEGHAEQITDPEEIKDIEWTDLEKMPTVAKYIKPDRAVFLKIIPKWLKYSDFSTEPWKIEELRFI
ncbi:MAG: pyridoxamine 5'-phosphate oxidase family protein [Candidatus Paceibacterales bacterium]